FHVQTVRVVAAGAAVGAEPHHTLAIDEYRMDAISDQAAARAFEAELVDDGGPGAAGADHQRAARLRAGPDCAVCSGAQRGDAAGCGLNFIWTQEGAAIVQTAVSGCRVGAVPEMSGNVLLQRFDEECARLAFDFLDEVHRSVGVRQLSELKG